MNADAITITIDFTGAGHYWLLEGGQGSGELDLLDCTTEAELLAAVAECVDAGGETADWSGWTARRVS